MNKNKNFTLTIAEKARDWVTPWFLSRAVAGREIY